MTTLSNSVQLALSVLSEAPPAVIAHAREVLAAMTKEPPIHSKNREKKEILKKNDGGDSPPRKGSIRGEVHRLLSIHKELSRRELIQAVAEARGEDPSRMEPQVDEALRRDRTGRICRTGRGLYRYRRNREFHL